MFFLLKLLDKLLCLPLIGLVHIYQYTLSPFIGMHCRFHPSCSNYMIDSISKYGSIHGVWKGIRRILRCHPGHPGGHDPA